MPYALRTSRRYHSLPPLEPLVFPLSTSFNSRFLRTSAGAPFLVNECSSWGLIQALTLSDAKDYIDKRVAQGFNAMKVSVVSYWQADPGGPPNWQGNPPFSVTNDFSTAAGATAYWSHADDVLSYMAAKGVLAMLVPCYLGYYNDSTQGWANIINNSPNDATKMAAYGTFLGNRYRSQPNIVWLVGGDQVPGTGDTFSVDQTRFLACMNALMAADPGHLVSGHFAGDYQIGGGPNDPVPGGMLSTDWAPLSSSVTLNGLYSYNPSVPAYGRLETGYQRAPTLPTLPVDQSYGSGFTAAQPQGSDSEIREKAHRAMCSGSCGSAFNAGSNWYLYTDWTTSSQSQVEASIWWNFWRLQPWSSMAPDLTSQYLVSGRGTYGGSGYVSAVASPTNLVAYVPDSAAPTVSMSKFSSARRADWFNPVTGATSNISPSVPNSGTQVFTNSGSGVGRLLVLS